MQRKILFIPWILLGVGCSEVASEDVRTSGMYAHMVAKADGSGDTLVRAQLLLDTTPPLVLVELTSGDELVASNGEEEQTLSYSSFGNYNAYSATFEGDEEDTEFTVSLTRPDGEDAPDSHTSLPKAFELDDLDEEHTFSRENDDLEVSWSPADTADEIAWQIRGGVGNEGDEGPCLHVSASGSQEDTGTLLIEAGTIQYTFEDEDDEEQETPENCELELTVERVREGDVDSAFKAGFFRGKQVRSLTVASTP